MAGPPQGPTHQDPTTPHIPQGGPGYAPGPEQRFDRPPGYDPYGQPQGHDRGAEAAAFARRHIRTPETKEFFKTSEFAVWAFTLILLFVAAATSDALDGGRMWMYATIASAAYMLSRGIAKSGANRGDPESHWGHDHRA
jgi:hypothetical protein